MPDTKYKLIYFNVAGVSEGIRYMFYYCNVDFEDCRIQRNDWPSVRKTLPFQSLPVLLVDGKYLNQSAAILRYLGKQFGLIPDDPWSQALLDALVDDVKDAVDKTRPYFFKHIPEKHMDLLVVAKSICNRLEECISDEGYFYGPEATWADFYIYGIYDVMKAIFTDFFTLYPRIEKSFNNMKNNKNIKRYLDNKGPEDPLFHDHAF